MPNIFLSHTSIDKPFVEKLAKDLVKFGINAWFDKWNIKVGQSITWEIEHGIRENEYLGLVLSPESLQSEWVKSELSSAWIKQMNTKRIVVLPLLYRDCNLPLFLADRKYADFRLDYNKGLEDLLSVFGFSTTETISEYNWRLFTSNRKANWKYYRDKEFEKLVTILVDRAKQHNWSVWVGRTGLPYSITLRTFIDKDSERNISIKLAGRSYTYMACDKSEWNPNNLNASDFKKYIGNTINECEEYVWRIMEDFKNIYGTPKGKAYYYTERYINPSELIAVTSTVLQEFDWYKGEKR